MREEYMSMKQKIILFRFLDGYSERRIAQELKTNPLDKSVVT